MVLAKRIIPCLDVKAGRTVKGVNFENLRDAGDIVELAGRYSEEGADELVFLDITASFDHRGTRLEWVERVARQVRIPFTVGGGISSERDVEALLKKGADTQYLRIGHAGGTLECGVDYREERGKTLVIEDTFGFRTANLLLDGVALVRI